MIVAFLSDIHLNFLQRPDFAFNFGTIVRKELEEYEVEKKNDDKCLIITGDIAESSNLYTFFESFLRGVNLPTYFTLGNHDFYSGSFETTHLTAKNISNKTCGKWLNDCEPIELTKDTCLVGHDGWYDARYGNEWTPVDLNDFYVIKDFTREDERGQREPFPRPVIVHKCREIADRGAQEVKQKLFQAAQKYKNVWIATHVPPFKEAAWHLGQHSDNNWAPWFSSKAMGDVLLDAAYQFPEVKFLCLCGHSHSEGVFSPTPNLEVITAKATYNFPEIYKIFEI